MMEKINWYKEVLEIEPNSKVFFPLAKLLVKDDMDAEAITTLEKGLERHPEFLEARLMLIELLHRNRDTEACDAQIAKLNQIFTSYAGFWEAWAACLSAKPADADTATIVRLLAATFITGPIHFHEVLDRGVASIVNEKQARETTESATPGKIISAQPQISQQENAPEEESVDFSPSDSPETEAVEMAAETTKPDDAAPMPEQLEIPASHVEEQPESQGKSEEMLPESSIQETAREPDDSDYDDSGLERIDAMLDNIALTEETRVPQEDILTAHEVKESAPVQDLPERMESGAPDADIPETAPKMDDDDKPDEAFSLRTRSMADVLASQGDIAGAIDIYTELAAAASDQQEKEELDKRIHELKGQEDQAETVSVTDKSIENIEPDKNNLLGILEALARRVQARVDS